MINQKRKANKYSLGISSIIILIYIKSLWFKRKQNKGENHFLEATILMFKISSCLKKTKLRTNFQKFYFNKNVRPQSMMIVRFFKVLSLKNWVLLRLQTVKTLVFRRNTWLKTLKRTNWKRKRLNYNWKE